MKQWKSCQFMSIHVSSCWFMVSCCTMRIMWIMWIKWIMWMLKIFDMICALWMHNVKARFSLATMRYDSTRLEDSNQGNLGNLGWERCERSEALWSALSLKCRSRSFTVPKGRWRSLKAIGTAGGWWRSPKLRTVRTGRTGTVATRGDPCGTVWCWLWLQGPKAQSLELRNWNELIYPLVI